MHRADRPIQRLLFSPGARRAWGLALSITAEFTLTRALSRRSESVVTFGWDKADPRAAFGALVCTGVIALHGTAHSRWWLAAGPS